MLEFLAYGPGKGIALDIPELGLAYLERVGSEGRSHRGDKSDCLGERGGPEDKVGLLGEGIDCIYDKVVFFHLERCGAVGIVNLLQGFDLGLRVDFEKTTAQGFDLGLSYGQAGCHQLTVTVGVTYDIGIDKGETANAAAHQSLGTPGAYSPDSENEHSGILELGEIVLAQQQPGTSLNVHFV